MKWLNNFIIEILVCGANFNQVRFGEMKKQQIQAYRSHGTGQILVKKQTR